MSVDDADAALDHLLDQLRGDDPDLLARTQAPTSRRVGDVRMVASRDDAGGGACSAISSADGRWILVSGSHG